MTNIKKNLIITHNNKSEINNTFLFFPWNEYGIDIAAFHTRETGN